MTGGWDQQCEGAFDASALHCAACTPRDAGSPYRSGDASNRQTATLERHCWEGPLEVYKCGACGGVFLPEGRLGEILRTKDNRYSVDIAARLHAHAYQHDPSEGHALPCPGCGGELLETRFRRSSIRMRVCFSCGGHWLDERALADIEALDDVTC